MKKDLEFLKIEDVAIGIVPSMDDEGKRIYTSHLINMKNEPLKNVLIRTRGMGMVGEEAVETSTLRLLIENVAQKSTERIDSFGSEATALSNEYWISFYHNDYLYDRKYTFVPESIIEENFIKLPILEEDGVMIV